MAPPVWLGWEDSNLRMPGSKPGALPLGDTPNYLLDYTNSFGKGDAFTPRARMLLHAPGNCLRAFLAWAALSKLMNAQAPVPVNLASPKLAKTFNALSTSG